MKVRVEKISEMEFPRRASAPYMLLGILTLGVWGCTASVTVKVKKVEETQNTGGPAPGPTPGIPPRGIVQQESRTAVQQIKTSFQSRQVIRIRLNSSLLGGAQSISVLNTTGVDVANENEAPVLVRDLSISQELHLTTATNIPGLAVSRDSDGIVLTIFPKAKGQVGESIRDLIRFGKNTLKVIAHDVSEDRFAYVDLTVRDFAVFGFYGLTFVDEREGQVASQPTDQGGYQFQGWLDTVAPPVVRVEASGAEGGELAVGLPRYFN